MKPQAVIARENAVIRRRRQKAIVYGVALTGDELDSLIALLAMNSGFLEEAIKSATPTSEKWERMQVIQDQRFLRDNKRLLEMLRRVKS